MTYIHNHEKNLKIALADYLCPKVIHTDLMNEIMDEIDSLFETYYELRGKQRKPLYDNAREILYEKIIPLEKQWNEEFRKNNEDYCKYWEI